MTSKNVNLICENFHLKELASLCSYVSMISMQKHACTGAQYKSATESFFYQVVEAEVRIISKRTSM